MKLFLHRLLLLAIGVFIGFAWGRGGAPKPNPQQLLAVGVDCYDSSGKLVQNSFDKFGGVTIACGPGQTARLHQAASH